MHIWTPVASLEKLYFTAGTVEKIASVPRSYKKFERLPRVTHQVPKNKGVNVSLGRRFQEKGWKEVSGEGLATDTTLFCRLAAKLSAIYFIWFIPFLSKYSKYSIKSLYFMLGTCIGWLYTVSRKDSCLVEAFMGYLWNTHKKKKLSSKPFFWIH